MRNVLFVTPRFPPSNAADAHRVRLSLPYYKTFGWNPIVLTVDEAAPAGDGPMLLESLPADVEVVRTKIPDERSTRRFGFGQLDYRSFLPLLREGGRLIRRRKIDVVVFSSTVFLSFMLGPIWKRVFGCKIVYDFQDPWYQGDPLPYTAQNAPGSWRRYRFTQALARRLEPIALRAADHVISVSDGYVDMLRARYAFLKPEMFTVLPFPASELDYEYATRAGVTHKLFTRDAREHWVYAGRGGPDMAFAVSCLCAYLRKRKDADPDMASKLRVHVVGTSYAPAGQAIKQFEPIARAFGVSDLVEEATARMPYFETLALYRDSDRVMLIGSDSADYTASKLFNCILSGRPVLALVHQSSLVARIATDFPTVSVVGFDPAEKIDEVAERLSDRLSGTSVAPAAIDLESLEPWLASASTQRQCAIFDRLVGA